MTTVIDRLILELGFDTSQLPAGQQKTVQSLRNMEDQLDRTGRKVDESGQRWSTVFRQIEHPLASLKMHFERLADYTDRPRQGIQAVGAQAQRTGKQVEAAGLMGAAGLRALGVAGLAAFGTLKLVHGLMNDVAQNAQRTFNTGVNASSAGMPIDRYSAVSKALLINHNVPEEVTQAWMTKYRNAIEDLRNGDPTAYQAMNAGFQRGQFFDVNMDEDDAETALIKMARSLAARYPNTPEGRARALGNARAVGMPDVGGLGLFNAGSNINAEIERAKETIALQKRDEAAADAARKAHNGLVESFNRLTTTIYNDLGPSLQGFEGWLQKILTDMNTIASPDAAHNKKMDVYGGMPVVSLEWWKRLLGGGTHQQQMDAYGSLPIFSEWWRRHLPTWLGGRPTASEGPSGSSASPGGTSGASRGTYSPSPSSDDVSAIRDAVANAGGNEFAQAGLLAAFNAEDPGLGPSTIERGAGKGASWGQWTNTSGSPRRAQLEAFGWTGKNPTTDRVAAAKMLNWELKTNPQFRTMIQRMNATGDATAAAKIAGFVFEQGGAAPSNFGHGNETQASLDTFHSRGADKFLAQLRSSSASTQVTHNRNTAVGGITVNVTSPDGANPYSLGGAIGGKVHDSILAAQANNGLTP